MNTRRLSPLLAVAALCAGHVIGAQRGGAIPPVHQLGATIARATDSIGVVAQLVELGDGRVVINDSRYRRLVILDSALKHTVVVFDTTTTATRLYPTRGGGTVLRYAGDTILFADPASLGFVVISPTGAIVRVVAFPPGPAPLPGFGMRADERGNLVYWARAGVPCGDHTTTDSIPLLRTRLSTRVVDTVAYARDNRTECVPSRPPGMPPTGLGGLIVPQILSLDAWALMWDGTVAVVHAANYTIDWVDPNGTRRATPQVAFEWKRVTDSAKVQLMDSLRVYYTHAADSAYQAMKGGVMFAQMPPDIQQQITLEAFTPRFLPPTELADYWHAFQAPVRGDADGNLWIPEAIHQMIPPPPGTPAPAIIYDIVNRQGVLIDRAQIPGGTVLVGFGPGVVYLTSREATTTALVRVRIR